MGLPKENFVILLLYSLTVGAFLGILWDAFRIIRIACYGKKKNGVPPPVKLPANEKEVIRALAFKHSQKFFSLSGILIFLSDLFFCISASISVILLIFHLNGGQIRGFAILGTFTGFTVYYFTVGKITIIFSDIIIKGIKKLISLILSVTLIPIMNFFKYTTEYLFLKINFKFRKMKTKNYINKQIKKSKSGFNLSEEKN